MWHWGDGWGWWMVVGWLWMIGFWALIIWAVVTLSRRGGEPPRPPEPTGGPSAIEILRRRYATGELSDEEFERRLRVLEARGGDRSGTGPT